MMLNTSQYLGLLTALILSGAAQGQVKETHPPPAPSGVVDRALSAGKGMAVATWTAATDWDAWSAKSHWRYAISPVSLHFRPSDEHRTVFALGAELQRADDWLAGASAFRNSFGQPSAYVYLGKRFPNLFGEPRLFGQFSAGILYGYKGKFKDKVPLNVGGFAPGALVSAGWQFTPRLSATLHMLGDAGVMLQLSTDLK